MNQLQFDADLNDSDAWSEGFGWVNNPVRQLFENPKQESERSWLDEDISDEEKL